MTRPKPRFLSPASSEASRRTTGLARRLSPAAWLGAALVLGGALPLATDARAAGSTAALGLGGSARLISEGPLEQGAYLAGIELALETGWHTYWRFPGDAGIPPLFDFSGSTNLRAAEVLYPVPEREDDGYSVSAVYHGGITLPLRVVPVNPAQPVELRIQATYGVCKDICVPRDDVLELALAPDERADKVSSLLIRRDLAGVPKPMPAEEAKGAYRFDLSEDGKSLLIGLTREGDALDLFVEGPEGSFNRLPERITAPSGLAAAWSLPLRGLAKTDDGGTRLRLVLSTADGGLESLHVLEAGDLSRAP